LPLQHSELVVQRELSLSGKHVAPEEPLLPLEPLEDELLEELDPSLHDVTLVPVVHVVGALRSRGCTTRRA